MAKKKRKKATPAAPMNLRSQYRGKLKDLRMVRFFDPAGQERVGSVLHYDAVYRVNIVLDEGGVELFSATHVHFVA